MNDDNQVKNQSSQTGTGSTTVNIQIPDNPVSSSHKEQIVSPHGTEAVQNQEIIKPSEIEPEIDREVLEAGVQQVPQKPPLDQEHVKIGITHSHESAPVSTSPSGIIKLPLTEEEAIQNRKKYRISASFRWLSEEIIRQARAMRRKMAG